ncbi:NAD(P)/FAD-dependent oxidoreductase [Propionivibrio limicola]|uniref:NAD(P)/FAD-dependent oxidoreductase n=1 Tax=Propionivibrio limicola TaxID=167645 RepID=UPI0012923AFF|nr:NAD(P)/FAD-dependent oxidoreductase [Propionivibrio limicola]
MKIGRPVVVVVGAGFGGLAAVKELAKEEVDIILIDQRNHHLFQPLLYQVATAWLSPAEIASPIRNLFSQQRNVTVIMGKVTGIDTEACTLQIDNGPRQGNIDYDYLVLATGASHDYFGNDQWATYAPGLKTVEDATGIRERLLMAFELAEMTAEPAERDAHLTIVVIGGGATGVEMAGSIAELARAALARDFRRIDPRQAKVILIESGPRVLGAFPEDLSEAAMKSLDKLGVTVLTNTRVSDCQKGYVMIGEEKIPAATVIWAAGVKASPAATWLNAEADRAGRVIVESDFSVPGLPNVFVVGDTASAKDATGQTLPGIAPAAKQAGRYAARVIRAKLHGKSAPSPFRYHNYGTMATIGRHAGVADFGWVKFKGHLGWWLWGIVHIFFLIDFRSRVVVSLNWLWSFLTYQRGARLITGNKPENPQLHEAS